MALPKNLLPYFSVQLGIFDVGYINERETIILRDEDKNDVEYTDNTRIKEMRLILQKYNKLLENLY